MNIAEFYEKYFGKEPVEVDHPQLKAFLADLYFYYRTTCNGARAFRQC